MGDLVAFASEFAWLAWLLVLVAIMALLFRTGLRGSTRRRGGGGGGTGADFGAWMWGDGHGVNDVDGSDGGGDGGGCDGGGAD